MCNLFVGIAVGFENKTELSSKVQSILRQESVCKTVDEVPISILLSVNVAKNQCLHRMLGYVLRVFEI